MMEHQLLPAFTEIPPMAPIINIEPMHQMETLPLGTTIATQYSANYSQMITHPKRSPRCPPCPQYWIQQIILVQVNPGETLTIKSDDGTIQNIQGPADVPLMSPSGTLPPIYLPPGYMSQVIEENGIRKIIVVPQTIDYHTTMPAPMQQVPQFLPPSPLIYPQVPQLMFPPAQGEFPLQYIHEPVPQQLPPPPPPPPLPPPPPAFMYQELQETYTHGRVNYHQFDERAAKIDYMKKKMRERHIGGHKNNYMITTSSLVENKTNDLSSVSSTPDTSSENSALTAPTADNTSSTDAVDNDPSTYTVDSTSSTSSMDDVPYDNTVDNTPTIHTVNSALDIHAADDTPTTDIIDDADSTHSTDETPTDHAPSPSASADTAGPATDDSAAGPYCDNRAPQTTTSDETPGPLTTDSVQSSSTDSGLSSFTDSGPSSSTESLPTTTDSLLSSSTESLPSSTESLPSSTESLLSSTDNLPSSSTNSLPSSPTDSLPSSSTDSLPSSPTDSVPSSSTNNLPSSSTDNLPSSSTDNPPSSSTDSLLSSPTDSLPSSPTDSLPSSSTDSLPISPTDSLPSSPTDSVPSSSTNNLPSSSTDNLPSSSTDSLPSSSTESLPSSSTESLPSSSTDSLTTSSDSLPSSSISNRTPNTSISDNAPSISAIDSVPGPSTSDNARSTSNTAGTSNTARAQSISAIDSVPGPSTSDNARSTSNTAGTSNTARAQSISAIDSVPGPSTSDNARSTSSTAGTSNTARAQSISAIDSVPGPSTTDNARSTSNTAGTSNTARAQRESNHSKKRNAKGSGDHKQESGRKQNKSQSSNAAGKESKTEDRKSCCFVLEKPVVSDIQTRSAVVSWNLQKCDHTKSPVIFELAVSNNGKNGKYKNIYIGDEVTFTLLDLQPSTTYYLRVTTVKGSEHRNKSDVVSFATPGCKPDTPLAPKLINRSKSSLNLQWKGSNDNGSKINSFLLEWDEGKGEHFKSCYMGTMKQHKILKLNASTKYSFRLAAKNNFGLSDFSEVAVFHTSGTIPPTPSPPKLKEAGISTLALEWCAPANINTNDSMTYVLEMEEAGSGLGFKPKYNGEDLSCTIRNLHRSTAYKFRIFAYNMEGRSNPSGEVKYTTCPDKPGPPQKPYVKGKIHPHRVKIGWDSPKDNGGTYISSYILEVNVNSDEDAWNTIYSGTTKEFLYDHLQPDTTYKLRVFCTSPIGKSQPSEVLTIQTATLSPETCQPPSVNGKTKPSETNLQSDSPSTSGNSGAPVHVKNTKGNQDDTTEPSVATASCTLGSHSVKRETAPVVGPPSQCGTPVLTCKGPTCVVVTWGIPQGNGAEITDYRLEWGPNEESMRLIYTGSCLRYEVKGLTPATTYVCRVQAVNVSGAGMFGGTGTVTTPATVPAVVPMLHEVENKIPAQLASSCLALQWEEPDCNGSPVTGYNIEYGDRKILTVNRVTECILKNLHPDTTYKIRIQAINHYGLSPFSQSIRIKTKPLPPEPPHLDCVVYGHQSLKLKWGNTSNKKLLSNLISYNLLMGDRSGRFSVIYHGPCLTHRVQRLGEYTQYKFKIQACNEAGEGPLSGIYTFTTTKTPPAALKAPKIHQTSSNVCEIKWKSLEPMKGDPVIYNLQVVSEKGTEMIYKGPNTSVSFSNFLTNTHYHFKVCAGRQYQNSAGTQELWGPYSPSTLFSTHKHHPHGKGKKGNNHNEEKDEKLRIEMSDDTFVLILLIGFALVAILCAVMIQHFLIN